jgi:cellulose synthase/poly-beta-1,6-N-acetylglucosamine synthase-like glycosyltransferase
MEEFILIAYFVSIFILFAFGSHYFIMIHYYRKYKDVKQKDNGVLTVFPMVTIQLPIYNEINVIQRLMDAVCKMNYPKDKLEIQILDDSTDETIQEVEKIVEEKKALGYDFVHVHRTNRNGYKAGALKEGLVTAKGEYIAIFDADFIPQSEFLMQTLPHFSHSKIGMVQTRWEHLNGDYSMITKAQAFALDAHFVLEQSVRNDAGLFIAFNGTGGIWRKECILDAGNWQADTLTEDLDLSYRAQLKGWKFVFLKDVTSPAELPSEINSLKIQQYRWTKGYIETAKKMLPEVWKSKLSLKMKFLCTLHLSSNFVFPFILLSGILNVPLVYIKQTGDHNEYFAIMSIFVLAFVGSFLFYLYSQQDIHADDWKKRIYLFPLFLSGSMGLAFNNAKAVIEGLFNKKTEFVRTPKSGSVGNTGNEGSRKIEKPKISYSVIFEFILALYSLFGIGMSVYYIEISAVPFQLMFFIGFGFISVTSIKNLFVSKKEKSR